MAKSRSQNPRTWGAVVMARLAGKDTPKELAPFVKALSTEQGKLETAASAVEAAKETRDGALDVISAADDALDGALLGLADRLVGASLGDRKNPFAKYSKYSPARLTELAYAVEVREALALVEAVTKVKPPADVKKALDAVTKAATRVDTALDGLTKPQADYATAVGARDALLPAWTKAMSKLKKRAASVWDEDPARLKAVFAPPDAVQQPVAKRAKKAKVEPTPS